MSAPSEDRPWLSVIAGLTALALITFGCDRLHLPASVPALLMLAAVVVQALTSRFWAAAVLSIFAVGCLDYFFIEPLFSFTVTSPADVIMLGAFLGTAIVVGNLAARARAEATLRRQQQADLQKLYDAAQGLLTTLPESGDHALRPLLTIFQLRAACLYDAVGSRFLAVGKATVDLEGETRAAYLLDKPRSESGRGLVILPLRVRERLIGALGLEGLERAAALAGPLSALCATMLDRAHGLQAVSEATAQARAVELRTALVDGLAHEFQTPLATILAAAGSLPLAGTLTPAQQELSEIIEEEAENASVLVDRLLRTAHLELAEVKLHLDSIDLAALVRDTVGQHRRAAPDRDFQMASAQTAEVAADPLLLSLAVSQLLANAVKYSPAGSPIGVSVHVQDRAATIVVENTGPAIPPAERERIFERLYQRAASGGAATRGSGLGLYVARKIAVAHGGALQLLPPLPDEHRIQFALTLPLVDESAAADAAKKEDRAVTAIDDRAGR